MGTITDETWRQNDYGEGASSRQFSDGTLGHQLDERNLMEAKQSEYEHANCSEASSPTEHGDK